MIDEDGIGRNRYTRRRILQGTAAGGAALTATTLIGCGANQPSSSRPTTTTVQPKRGGTFIHTNAQETTENLDPQTSTPFKGMGLRLVYQGLLGYDSETYEV